MNQIKLIYNPKAGEKKMLSQPGKDGLKQILSLLKRYQLDVDPFLTKGPNDAVNLAQKAIKEGYKMVVVVGGDGTANEAANGLAGSNLPLGIIPQGTFMNIAKMLSIPFDTEKAVELLKIKRIRKIDLGVLSTLNGEKLDKPHYFIETSGIGTEAHIQLEFKKFEKGSISSLFSLIKHIFSVVRHRIEIVADGKIHHFRANFVTVANGPFGGASLELAPDAKLNDHFLTVVVYQQDRHKMLKHFLKMLLLSKTNKKELITIKAKEVTVSSRSEMLVHADASLFGKTPVHYRVKPECLKVICGFPESFDPVTFVKTG